MSEHQGHFVVKGGSDRSFGLVFAGVFGLIGLWPLIGAGEIRLWALAVSVIFALIALIAPGMLAPLNKLWFRLGMLLGAVVAPIVMGVVFFLTVTPVGIVVRLLGGDPLRLKKDRAAKSYWIVRTQPIGSMKNQF